MNINVTKDEIKKDPLDNTIIHKGEYHVNPLNFFFSEEYEGLNKKAIFEDDNNKVEVEIINNSCDIPSIILNSKSNYFNLRVYGYSLINGQVEYRYSPTYETITLYEGSYISNVTVLETSNGSNVNIQTVKTIPDITTNGYVSILPDVGYDGMAEVDFNVNVPTGGSELDLTSGVKFAFSTFYNIPNFIINANWEDITDGNSMFNNSSITSIPLFDTSELLQGNAMFANDYNLTTVSQIDTSSMQDMTSMFENDTILEDVPQLDTTNCTSMMNMFLNCPSLTNTSLNNILAMCTNVGADYVRPKALKDLGLDDTQIATCHSLSNYQDALDAGWTDYLELTVDVSLNDIYAESGLGNYIVPQIGVFDGYIYEMGVQLTLNDPVLQTQVTGVLNGNHFDSNDLTLSFDVNYTGLPEGNQYYFENINYTP